jgi:hypothetical protein
MKIYDIHISGTEAFIQGEEIRTFSSMKALLHHLGCNVMEHRVEVHEASGVQTAHAKFNVEFPARSRIIKYPKDRNSNTTASGRKRKGAKKVVKIGWPLNSRMGRIMIPGEDSDYIVTFYDATEHSPSYFDRGVTEVEKD